jgi:hypothetical protein
LSRSRGPNKLNHEIQNRVTFTRHP